LGVWVLGHMPTVEGPHALRQTRDGCSVSYGRPSLFLVSGFWFLVSGFWFLVSGFWLLVSGCWLLVAGCWLLVAGCWLLVSGCWFLFYVPAARCPRGRREPAATSNE
jgi:hypothetical protein